MASRVAPMGPQVKADLRAKAKRLEKAREAEQKAWEELVLAVKAARASNHGLEDIGDQIGVSKARIYQMVSGKR